MKSEFVRIIPRVSFYSFIYQAAILIVQKQHKINIYRPQTKLRKGFYTCLSVILFMGGSVSQHALGHTDTPWADNPLPSACWDTPPRQPLLRTLCILLECILVFQVSILLVLLLLENCKRSIFTVHCYNHRQP